MGSFFAVELSLQGPHWQPLDNLVSDRELLAARVETARLILAAQAGVGADQIDNKVAASLVQFGLVARLIAPAAACAVLSSSVPDLDPGQVWWQPRNNDPVPLSIPQPRGRSATSLGEIAEALSVLVIDAAIQPLVHTTEELFGISPKVLWGNVASGLAGAAEAIGASRPDLAQRAADIVAAVLARASLHASGAYTDRCFQRRSCCLYYRIPNARLCGDCILVSRDSTPV